MSWFAKGGKPCFQGIVSSCSLERPWEQGGLGGVGSWRKRWKRSLQWSAEWSLRYAQKCSQSWVKNSEQNFLPLLHAKNCHLDDAFLNVFSLQASPVEGQSLQQKEQKRRNRKGEKNSKHRKVYRRRSLSHPKFWFLLMPKSQCAKTWC